MKVFIFLTIVAVAFANECGKNASYKTCGTACPDTCENYFRKSPICTLNCVVGCQCDEGYVKNEANGECVKATECPAPKCGENAHFTNCGTACPDTCDNFFRKRPFCTLQCVIGCECDKGYVKNEANGQCVKATECPTPKCGENERFDTCGSACPDTCNNYFKPMRPCTMNCVLGCRCEDGYVRNEADGRCVKPTDCPTPKCGENEHFTTCGTACPSTCNNYFRKSPICTLQCVIGCQCDKGYLRNEADGRCVRAPECPTPTCGKNEQFESCGTACPLTCDNYKEGPLPCVLRCDIGCHCLKGYVRNSEGECVKPEYCPADSEALSAPGRCLQDKKVGMCKALIPRYYYNKESGQCEKFFYGGCGGNSNNFKTKEECEAICLS